MSMFVNSGKKITYFEKTLENLTQTNKEMQARVAELRAAAEAIRTVTTDLAYNAVAEMAIYLNDGINAAGKASCEILGDLAKLNSVGPVLVENAKRVGTDAEAVAALKMDAPAINKEVMSGRGMDESWTPENIAAFAEAAAGFIRVRKRMIDELAQNTSAAVEEDFREVYMTIGRHIETAANNTVDAYNQLKEHLEAAGHGLDAAVNNSLEAAQGVNVGELNANTDLAGAVMDI